MSRRGKPPAARCREPACGVVSTATCSYPLADTHAGKLCGVPLCDNHRRDKRLHNGKTQTLCPAHERMIAAEVAKARAQLVAEGAEFVGPEYFTERAAEKQRSRDADAAALADGSKTVEQLRAENGAFAFPGSRIRIVSVNAAADALLGKKRKR